MHLSKNILRALEANKDVPPLSQYPKAHQVCCSPGFNRINTTMLTI